MMTDKSNYDYAALSNKLKTMRLSAMAETLEAQLADPNSNLRSFDDRIFEVINAEWDVRYSKKYNRFLKKATLKYPAVDIDATI